MAKLLTGTRIYGTGTVDTQLFVSGTNSATSTTTGALQVVGGVGVGGNLHVGGIIYGAILGTATTATNADNIKTVLQTSSASHYLAFVDSNNSTAAYEALYTTSSFVINPQSGNVGIGVTPATKLHVYGSGGTTLRLQTASTSSGNFIDFYTPAGIRQGYIGTVDVNGNFYIHNELPTALIFDTNNAERLRITGTGSVGIGTNSPSYPLHLLTTSTTSAAFRNSTSTTTQILIGNTAGDTTIRTLGSGDSFIFSDTSKYLAFGTGATERLRITANGGISFGGSGTAYGVSGQILQSNGDAAPTWISTGSLAAANATTATHLSGGTAGQVPYQTAPGVTSFYGPGTAGNVLVSNGTSAPSYNNTLTLAGTTAATSTTTGTLVVVGGVGIGHNLFVNNNINAVSGQFVSTRANNTATGAGQIYLNGASGNRIDFNQNGVAAPAFTTRSAGTKLVLYPNISASDVDYAIGMESSVLWFSVSTTARSFKWYGGTTLAAQLSGTGNLTLVGDLAVNGGDITTTQATFNLINTTATTVNFAGSATTLTMGASGSGTTNVRNNLTVSGNLTVQGTTTIVDSTVTNIADPIITLGGGTGNTAPIADDNKDRGVAFKWVNDGGTTSTGFFGYDDSTGHFTYVQTATITNEVVSGTKGAMDVNLAGGTAMSLVYQSAANTTAFLAAGSSGFFLQTNGTGSAPAWVSAAGIGAGSATNSDAIRTIERTTNASHFLTFVDSNNATNAYESLYTTSSFVINPQSGNVGIGTSSPGTRLEVYDSNDSTTVTAGIRVTNASGTTNSAAGVGFQNYDNYGAWIRSLRSGSSAGILTFGTNNGVGIGEANVIERVRVDSGGNVNIGTFTTSISKKFTVVGEGNFSDASNLARLYMGFGTIPTTGGTGAYIYNNDNTPLAFGTTNTERMRISTTGDVGIGTTSPTYRLTVTTSTNSATTTASTIALHLFNLASDGNISQPGRVGIGFGASTTRSAIVAGTYGNDYLDFYTSGDITTPKIRIRSTGAIAFSGTNTYGTSGFVLKSNGDAAPTWVNASTLASGSATNADNIRTVAQTASATYYPTFVDSHNASAAYESLYTSGIFTINPNTGFVGIGSQDGVSPLNVKVLSTLSGTINSFQKVLTTQAAGGLGNNVYRSEWRRRRAAGTDWTTQNIHDGIWVDSSYTTPGTDTRTWWDRDPATPSQAWGDQTTTWMFHNSSALFLTGGSSQLNTGFTNRLNVSGAIVAGSVSSPNGSIILQGQYGTGSITNLGTEYSSGGPVLGYGVYPSNTATGAFFSSSGLALTRGAYTIAGNVHNWYVGASQTLAIGSTATLALAMTLNSTGALAFNGASNYGTSGQVLQSNDNAPPTWVALSGRTVGTSTQVQTVLRTTNATHYLTFVDSNNASATAEAVYTTSSFTINAMTGNVGIAAAPSSTATYRLNVSNIIQVGAQGGSDVTLIGGGAGTGSFIRGYHGTDGTQAFNIVGNGDSYINASSAGGILAVGTATMNTNGKLQVNGGIGIAPNNIVRQTTNADGGTLKFYGTQFVAGGSNSGSYGYAGSGLIASVSPSASAVVLDVGGQGTGTSHRLKVINDGTGNTGYLYYGQEGGSTATLYANASNGYVGINTTSPAARFHMGLTGSASMATSTISSLTNVTVTARAGFSGLANNNDGIYFGTGLDGGICAGLGLFREASGWSSAIAFYTNNITDGTNVGRFQEKMRITSNGGISFGASQTAYGTSGQILQSNGNAAPTWIALSSRTVGTSTQVNTVLRTTSANHFLTFVDSNNATATAETVYTTSSFYINPSNGNLTLTGLGGFTLGQPTPINFANGQYIKDNGGGGFVQYSGAAFQLIAAAVGGITMGTSAYAQQASALLSVNGSIHATEYLISAASSQQVSGAKIQRVYSTSAVAGSIYPLGTWNDTEGTVALEIQVSSETSAHSGTATYRWQGGYAQVPVVGTYYRLFPFNDGRGHGDGADTGLNLNAWGVYVYKTDDYTYGIAVSVAAGRTAKTLVTTISELKRGMTYVAGTNVAVASWTAGASVYSHKNLIVESLGVGTAASGTLGEIRAANEITAYYSSDINLKENIKLIVDPLGKLEQIRGVSYDWKDEHIKARGGEDGYFVRKHDIGVIAQEVEAVLPEIVATRDDGTKVVKYEKLVALLIEAVKEQQKQINQISQALQNLAIK